MVERNSWKLRSASRAAVALGSVAVLDTLDVNSKVYENECWKIKLVLPNP